MWGVAAKEENAKKAGQRPRQSKNKQTKKPMKLKNEFEKGFAISMDTAPALPPLDEKSKELGCLRN